MYKRPFFVFSSIKFRLFIASLDPFFVSDDEAERARNLGQLVILGRLSKSKSITQTSHRQS